MVSFGVGMALFFALILTAGMLRHLGDDQYNFFFPLLLLHSDDGPDRRRSPRQPPVAVRLTSQYQEPRHPVGRVRFDHGSTPHVWDCVLETDLFDKEVPMSREATITGPRPEHNRPDADKKAVKPLSVEPGEAGKVKGGLRVKSDPCEGGE